MSISLLVSYFSENRVVVKWLIACLFYCVNSGLAQDVLMDDILSGLTPEAPAVPTRNFSCPALPVAPPCPSGSSTILDDSFPAMAYVISSNNLTETAGALPATFITEIFNSHPEVDSVPVIIVPDSAENFAQLEEQLRQLWSSQRLSDTVINARLSRISNLPTEGSYTWQQDYFESFYDRKSGRPVVRRVAEYDRQGHESVSTAAMGAALSGCGGAEGPLLARPETTAITGDTDTESGGNIEALPGGRCIVGDNQEVAYTAQFCPNSTDQVHIDTDWLMVGHADEIISVVPNRPATGACPYTFMLASPQKGFELLRQNPNDMFIDPGNLVLAENETRELALQRLMLERITKVGEMTPFGFLLCSAALEVIFPAREAQMKGLKTPTPSHEVRGTFYFPPWPQPLRQLLQFEAIAQEEEVPDDPKLARAGECMNRAGELSTITNGEMLAFFESDPQFMQYNELVQAHMNEARTRLRGLYPACGESNFRDVPDIFHGEMVEGSRPPEMARGFGASLFPNPTNGVMSGQNYLFPDPMNGAFRRYLQSNVLTGVGARFIDTWDYAHENEGNLHCSSHSLRYCTPAGGAR